MSSAICFLSTDSISELTEPAPDIFALIGAMADADASKEPEPEIVALMYAGIASVLRGTGVSQFLAPLRLIQPPGFISGST